MKRASVVLMGATILLTGLAGAAQAYVGAGAPGKCPPGDQFITVMTPCVKSEWVARTQPCMTPMPVKRVCFKDRKVLIKATPVGPACGTDPCVRCCPRPMYKVVNQKVPMVYYEQKMVPSYNISYEKVNRKVMVPYTYKVDAYPVCR
jgi:hypothetical protein